MKFFIQDSRSYVGNDVSWWRQGRDGYTTNLNQAGLFTGDEASLITNNRMTDIAWPEEYVRSLSIQTVSGDCLNYLKDYIGVIKDGD